MMSQRTYSDYVEDIIEAIEKIALFIEGSTYSQFCEDEKTSYAVVRGLEIIGEATKNIPESMRKKFQDIPWRSMAGMRDKLTHQYFGVDLEVVWKTAKEDLPGLIPKLKEILNQLD